MKDKGTLCDNTAMRYERLGPKLYIIKETVHNEQVQTEGHAVGSNAV